MNINFKNIFKELSIKFLIGEIILFIFALYLIGYITNKNDPFFMESSLRFLFHLLPITIITLFYGIFAGLIYYIGFSAVSFLVYKHIDYEYFLSLLLFLLVFSEFWFYWDKKIKEAEEKFKYADGKLRDLARNLLLVKLSHDQLEKFYISKPVSLRKLLNDIKNEITKNKDIEFAIKKTFDLIVINFNIEKGAIFKADMEDKFTPIQTTGGFSNIDTQDPLVKTAIQNKNITYLPELVSADSKYLAVIPFYEDDTLKYLLIIEKMPFLSLNQDNLLSINLILDYIIKESQILIKIEKLVKRFSEFDTDFLKEVYRMAQMNKKFKIESSIVYFYINNLDSHIFEIFLQNIRGLDLVNKVEFKTYNFQGIAVLLPFTDVFGAKIFINRILSILKEQLSTVFVEKNIRYKVYKIENPDKTLLNFYYFEGF